MSKENAKKNIKKNYHRLRTFKLITVVVNILYLLLVFGYHRKGVLHWRTLLGITFWLGQEIFYFRALQNFGKPSFSADGATLQSCLDLSNPAELGPYGGVQDMLWVCWVVQVLCGLHGFFFVLYFPVPGIILFQSYSWVKPLLAARSGASGEVVNEMEKNGELKGRALRRKEALDRRKGRKVES